MTRFPLDFKLPPLAVVTLTTFALAACGGSGSSSQVADVAAAPILLAGTTVVAQAVTWTNCGAENGTCNFTGTMNVRYGANGQYVYKLTTGPVACNNVTFADPAPGAVKACDYSNPPLPPSSAVWTHCASEGAACNYSGSKYVRYGANDTFASKMLTGPVQCNNTVFGDPVPNAVKGCDYIDTTIGSVPLPIPTLTPPVSASRDPLKWPFAVDSIWNMPIGSNAVYVAANLPAVPGNDSWAPMPQMDEEHIIMRPTAPPTNVYSSNAGWSGQNRCNASGGVLLTVPIPSSYTLPSGVTNGSAVALKADGRTLIHMQPLARCTAGGAATAMVIFPAVDLYGTGISGSHGGSGMSAIGGSLRVGELRPGSQGPKHALKVNIYAKQSLYRCATYADCFRWPATNADGYAVGFYGALNNNSNRAMKMGALLAIPASRDINSLGLETAPAKQLAWTLQNYGAYIVDDTYGASFALNVENGPDGSLPAQFKADYGFDFEQRVNSNSGWSRDMQRLSQALSVIDNNRADNIGGGGTPRQPLAPALQ